MRFLRDCAVVLLSIILTVIVAWGFYVMEKPKACPPVKPIENIRIEDEQERLISGDVQYC